MPSTQANTDRLSSAVADRYRIERHLGEGGMASVYLAYDVRHDRRVAVKVLKPELAAVLGADRFVQEIRTTANLQHPHILPLFDSGTADGFLFYVMPFIDGETLRQRLNRENQLGIEPAVQIARDVADALEYAHRHGVIHRDIKPENILLQDGRPMVADFGIALAVSAAAGGRMTESGLSLGTPHYMSPEQATAERELTPRSDVYSLGAVLYEMLSGEPPHMGTSAQQIIMKIVTDPARPITQLRKSVPPHVAAAVAKALEKLAADRFETARAFGDALGNPAFTTPGAAPAARPASSIDRGRMWIASRAAIAIGALAVGALLGVFATNRRPGSAAEVGPWPTRFRLTLPESGFTPTVPAVAISPNGRFVAYRVGLASGYSLRLQDLTAAESRPIAESEASPTSVWMMFSPDSRWLAFTSGQRVMRVDVSGGPATGLVRTLPLTRPAWIAADIMVGADSTGALARLRLSDGSVTRITTPTTGTRHRDPVAMADGARLLFTIEAGAADTIAIASGDGAFRSLGIPGERALGFGAGHLFYLAGDNAVLAVPVDLDGWRVTGAPSPVLPPVQFVQQAAMMSASGALVFAPDVREWATVRVDQQGVEQTLDSDPRNYSYPRLSPDGTRIAYTISDATRDVWISTVGARRLSRLTTGGATHPEWTPDSKYVLFISSRSGRAEVWRQRADFSAPPEQVTSSTRKPEGAIDEVAVSPDGRTLMVRLAGPAGQADLYWLPMTGSDTLRPFVTSPFSDITPRFSPDSRWVAYASNASGEFEVYVQPFPGPGPRVQVSTDGGRVPLWSHDGRRLYYRRVRENLVADVRLRGTTIAFGPPRTSTPPHAYRTGSLSHQDYDITLDGGFIFVKPLQPPGLDVILNLPGMLNLAGAR